MPSSLRKDYIPERRMCPAAFSSSKRIKSCFYIISQLNVTIKSDTNRKKKQKSRFEKMLAAVFFFCLFPCLPHSQVHLHAALMTAVMENVVGRRTGGNLLYRSQFWAMPENEDPNKILLQMKLEQFLQLLLLQVSETKAYFAFLSFSFMSAVMIWLLF